MHLQGGGLAMKAFLGCVFIGLLSVGIPSVARSDQNLLSEEAVAYEISLQTADAMIRISEEASADQTPLSQSFYWEQRMKEFTGRLLDLRVPRARSALEAIGWKKVLSHVEKAYSEIRSTARLNGFGMAIATLSGMACEVVVPIALTLVGLPQFIPFSPMIPYATLSGGAYRVVSDFLVRKKMTAYLGGKKAYEEWKAQQRILREKLRITSNLDLLVPFERTNSQYQAVVIRKASVVRALLSKLGWKTRVLTFSGLRKFCKQENVAIDTIEILTHHQKHLPEHIKTAALLYDLRDRFPDSELWDRLEAQFSEGFVVQQSRASHPEMLDWTQKMASAHSIEELIPLVEEIPSDAGAKDVFSLWNRVVLPQLAEEGRGITFRQIRALVKGSIQIQAHAILAGPSRWSAEWKTVFLKLISAVIGSEKCDPLLHTPKPSS